MYCKVLYSLCCIVHYSTQEEESVSQAGHDSNDGEVEEEPQRTSGGGDLEDEQEVRQPRPPPLRISLLTHCRAPPPLTTPLSLHHCKSE